MEYYNEPITGSGYNIPEWRITAHLITYAEANFQNDAAIEDVIQPTKKQMFQRKNPICNNPQIVINNTGANDLTSLEIKYGIVNGPSNTWVWNGSLKFMEMDTVFLPPFDWGELSAGDYKFEFELSKPNNLPDEYQFNNKMTTDFSPTPEYYKQIVLWLQTNKYAAGQGNQDFKYFLKNSSGEVLYQRSNMSDNTLYKDTFNLENGCYEFTFTNALGYGLDFWAIRDQLGSGSMRMTCYGKDFKVFSPDFGQEAYHQFSVVTKPTVLTNTDSLDFGTVRLDSTKVLPVEVSADNEKGIEISRVQTIFPTKRGFDVLSTVPDLTSGPLKLNKGEKMIINVKFTALKHGISNSTLNIYSNDELNSLKQVKLAAFGQDPAGISDFDEKAVVPDLKILSNPATEKVKIEFSCGIGSMFQGQISLYNSLGQKIRNVFTGSVDPDYNSLEFDTRELNSGVYYLIFNLGTKSIVKGLVIVK